MKVVSFYVLKYNILTKCTHSLVKIILKRNAGEILRGRAKKIFTAHLLSCNSRPLPSYEFFCCVHQEINSKFKVNFRFFKPRLLGNLGPKLIRCRQNKKSHPGQKLILIELERIFYHPEDLGSERGDFSKNFMGLT